MPLSTPSDATPHTPRMLAWMPATMPLDAAPMPWILTRMPRGLALHSKSASFLYGSPIQYRELQDAGGEVEPTPPARHASLRRGWVSPRSLVGRAGN